MKPIILLSIIAVTAVATGSGFLTNGIDLWVQQFGVEEEDITSPVSHAQIDFNIVKVGPNSETGFFQNIIQDCIVTLSNTVGQTVDMDGNSVITASQIQCKLTDASNNIIAEGVVSMTYFPGGVPITIKITQGDPVDVQDVHDVKLVVQANTHS